MLYSDQIVTLSWIDYILNNFCFVYVLHNQPCNTTACNQSVCLIDSEFILNLCNAYTLHYIGVHY